jgi:hypothetical protein
MSSDHATILSLVRAGQHGAALEAIARSLEDDPDCPYVLVLQAISTMLNESPLGPGLEQAERALLRAVEIDGTYLPALEELAHYYDAVAPDPQRARMYASRWITVGGRVIADMHAIVDGRT